MCERAAKNKLVVIGGSSQLIEMDKPLGAVTAAVSSFARCGMAMTVARVVAWMFMCGGASGDENGERDRRKPRILMSIIKVKSVRLEV